MDPADKATKVNAQNLAALGGTQLQKTRSLVHDAVVDVVLSSRFIGATKHERISRNPTTASQIHAKMVISIWRVDEHRFFSLTFSSSAAVPPPSSSTKPTTRTVSRLPKTSSTPSSLQSNSPGSSSQTAVGRGLYRGSTTSPSQGALAMAPYCAPSTTYTPSVLEKTMKMKDAMLNATDVPLYAMWKDGSLGFPNKAAGRLMLKPFDPTTDDAYDPLSRFEGYTEDFSRRLEKDEYPIVELIRTKKPFKSRRIGGFNSKGQKVIWDASGEAIYDENGDFIAGMTALKDVTRYTDLIKYQSEMNEKQFEMVCDAIPEMLWRTGTDGLPSEKPILLWHSLY